MVIIERANREKRLSEFYRFIGKEIALFSERLITIPGNFVTLKFLYCFFFKERIFIPKIAELFLKEMQLIAGLTVITSSLIFR